MNAGITRAILILVVVASAAGISSAQQAVSAFSADHQPMESILPDAPSPGTFDDASSVEYPSLVTKQNPRQPFSIGMTTREKYALAYRRIVSPQLPMKAAFVSGWELATGTGPDFRTNGWGPFAQRFGYNAATISTTIFFNTAVVPSLVHQDPRYFPMGYGSVKSRIGWAVKSEFVGFGDDGHRMPNYANLVGFALSSIVANAYRPQSTVSAGDTAKSYAIKVAVSTGLNVVREFQLFDQMKTIMHHSKNAEE